MGPGRTPRLLDGGEDVLNGTAQGEGKDGPAAVLGEDTGRRRHRQRDRVEGRSGAPDQGLWPCSWEPRGLPRCQICLNVCHKIIRCYFLSCLI